MCMVVLFVSSYYNLCVFRVTSSHFLVNPMSGEIIIAYESIGLIILINILLLLLIIIQFQSWLHIKFKKCM